MESTNSKFEYITSLPDLLYKFETNPDEKPEKDSKELLNKLISSNNLKKLKIVQLERLISDHNKIVTEQTTIEQKTDLIFNFQIKLSEKEKISKQEKIEQEILLNKKENLKTVTEAMKGKLIELQKNFDRITTNYSAFSKSSFVSKYTLMLSNKALEEFKEYFESSKKLFKSNISKLENRLKSTSEMNFRISRRASSVDADMKKKKKLKKEFLKCYETCLENFAEITHNRKLSTQKLEDYKAKFDIIIKFSQAEGGQDGYFEENQIKKIIEKLKFMEYRSESLNFAYKNLSETEVALTKDLTNLKSELIGIKKSLNESKTDHALPPEPSLLPELVSAEYFLIKIYFSLAEILSQSFESFFSEVQASIDKEIEYKITSALKQLRKIRVGIPKRNSFRMERFILGAFVPKNTYTENKNEIINSIPLSSQEIMKIYSEVAPKQLKNAKLLTEIIEVSPIIKTFLDKDSLKRHSSVTSNRSIADVLISLISNCYLVYQDKFKSFTQDSLYALKALADSNSNSLHETKNRQNSLFSRPIEYKARRNRSLDTSPYKIIEKNSKKHIENAKTEINSPEIQHAKDNSRIPRVYMISSKTLREKQVMKEVLENQKKETFLRTIEKKISKTSEKNLNLPYQKKFILGSSGFVKKISMSNTSRGDLSIFKKRFL